MPYRQMNEQRLQTEAEKLREQYESRLRQLIQEGYAHCVETMRRWPCLKVERCALSEGHTHETVVAICRELLREGFYIGYAGCNSSAGTGYIGVSLYPCLYERCNVFDLPRSMLEEPKAPWYKRIFGGKK